MVFLLGLGSGWGTVVCKEPLEGVRVGVLITVAKGSVIATVVAMLLPYPGGASTYNYSTIRTFN